MKDERVYEILKRVWEQNTKPHMAFLVLNMHKDMDFHRGKHLVDKGYDITEVYDAIEVLVAKDCLERSGKKTKITEKGLNTLKFVDEAVKVAGKLVIK